jgi:hypothetical protein
MSNMAENLARHIRAVLGEFDDINLPVVNCVRNLAATVRKLSVEGKWISVKDRLPEYGQKVIAYMEDRDSAILTVFLDDFALARTGVNGFEDHGVSHWMPLADAPE